MNPTLPDFTMSADEVRQCVQCGESKTANRICRDLDNEGDFYCVKCAWWTPIPQQDSEQKSPTVKRIALKKKHSKTPPTKPTGKPKKFIVVSFPNYEEAGLKPPSKS